MQVYIKNQKREYPNGITYGEIAKDFQKDYKQDIVLASIDGKLQELNKVARGGNLSFVTTAETVGMETYKRSLTMLLMKAIFKVAGENKIQKAQVHHSVSKGYYCTVTGDISLNQEFLDQVESKMRAYIEKGIVFEKRSVHTDDAVKIFHMHGMYDKEKLLRYRRSSRVNLYSLGAFEDYYYGYMVPNTSYLKYFSLHLYGEGFVLQFPTKENPKVVALFEPQHKVSKVLQESTAWAEALGISTVGDLNECICKGKIGELILVQEALQEKRLAEIAQKIVEDKGKKFVMIAGPSSSGKTTTSHRLSTQLKVVGLKPHPIAVDNYFAERDELKVEADGSIDFESLDAMDVELFNDHMTRLLKGERVEIPTFNFKLGKKEYNGNFLELKEDDILVIEGIHCLNDEFSRSLPKESKFKIYVSALTQLNVDEHNRIPTTDGRLLRRMVRDARTRGTSAPQTIQRWPSVRRGEEENIFPYQEEADAIFNTALLYELAVLKQYAEPSLFAITQDQPEYEEAKRLLKFLDYFIGIDSVQIPNNSILREFIGGSCLNV